MECEELALREREKEKESRGEEKMRVYRSGGNTSEWRTVIGEWRAATSSGWGKVLLMWSQSSETGKREFE